jgi:mycothiol synthase
MKIKISDKLNLWVARPLWIEYTVQSQLELRLPSVIKSIEIPEIPLGFTLRNFEKNDEYELIELFASSGFEFTFKQVDEILASCLPNGCFIIEESATKKMAATMMARHLSSPNYPFGGRIDWLVTDPKFRANGLGNICARCATDHLLKLGYENIWVTTDDDRIAALKIFLKMGFKPVIKRDSEIRWQSILNKQCIY